MGVEADMASSEESTEPAKKQLDEMQEKLSTLPTSMLMFGQTIRSFYTVNQVSGKEARTFLEVRDNTRKNGIVYADKVLPLTEEVVRSIGVYMNYFTDLDFEEWSECLEDIIDELTTAHTCCQILKQMHNTIIVDLKKNQDKAIVGIEMMNKMTELYKGTSEELRNEIKQEQKEIEQGQKEIEQGQKEIKQRQKESKQKLMEAGNWKKRELFFDIGTLGMNKLWDYCLNNTRTSAVCEENAKLNTRIAETMTSTAESRTRTAELRTRTAESRTRTAEMKTRRVVRNEENAIIASTCVGLTRSHLIPAIANFIEGLEVCSLFLNDTRERLLEVKKHGEKGGKKPFYKMMQNRANEINANTKVFLGYTDKMRNDLAAIPDERDDKNYVDHWFDMEMKKFQIENNEVWPAIFAHAKKITKSQSPKKLELDYDSEPEF